MLKSWLKCERLCKCPSQDLQQQVSELTQNVFDTSLGRSHKTAYTGVFESLLLLIIAGRRFFEVELKILLAHVSAWHAYVYNYSRLPLYWCFLEIITSLFVTGVPVPWVPLGVTWTSRVKAPATEYLIWFFSPVFQWRLSLSAVSIDCNYI